MDKENNPGSESAAAADNPSVCGTKAGRKQGEKEIKDDFGKDLNKTVFHFF